MASGLLGAANPAAATDTTLYTVPAGKLSTVNVSITNRGSGLAKVRLALAATASPTTSEWLEYDVPLPANGVLERTGIVMEAGKLLVVYTDVATVSCNAFGFEE